MSDFRPLNPRTTLGIQRDDKSQVPIASNMKHFAFFFAVSSLPEHCTIFHFPSVLLFDTGVTSQLFLDNLIV